MKKIFLSQRVEIIKEINERRDALSQEWSALAEACGFIMAAVPNSVKTAKKLLEELSPDGIILTGGNDLCKYGGDAPERDETEKLLIEYSMETKTPLLGVCRGAQMILDCFGAELKKVDGHIRTTHVLDSGKEVNSFHSRAAEICCPPLCAEAHSEDGFIEEFAHENGKIRGIMWHPERYDPLRTDDINMIKEFFDL